MTDLDKYNVLNRIYLDPSHPASFSTADKLYNAAKKIDSGISKKDVITFLQSRDSFTRHGIVQQKYVHRPVLVHKPGHLLAGDLADMTDDLRQSNNNYRYLLCLVDCYSRYASVYPLEDKQAKTVGDVLDVFFTQNYYNYNLFWIDKGSEFYNHVVYKVLDKHRVKMYSVFNNRIKSSYAERFIRTLKCKIYKYFTEKNTETYYDVLPEIVSAYNSSPHRGLNGRIPKQVHHLKNEQEIRKLEELQYKRKLLNYNKFLIKKHEKANEISSRFNLQPSTYVRLLLACVEQNFVKAYKPIYTIEIFEIYKVDCERIPTVYYLKDLQGELISGMVYRHELKVVNFPDTFLVEKVLKTKYCQKTKTKLYFVKFVGYPDKFNSWTPHVESIKS